MSKNIVIGTITACYNAGRFFGACLNGLLTQTLKPNIITVIDDRSTDNSWELIQEAVTKAGGTMHIAVADRFSATLNSIAIEGFRKPKNSGPAATRNVGVAHLKD